MATIKYAEKKYNGASWDTYYPKTTGDQIIDDATHRLTTDAEKAAWNAKAARPASPTAGNLAQLDANGDLVDSGKKVNNAGTGAGDLWTADQVQAAIDAAAAGTGSALKPAVADIAALKALNTTSATAYPDRCLINVEAKGLYRLDRDSSTASDDDRIVAPTTGVGRWFKMASAINDHDNLSGLQGGATGEHYHLTAAQAARAAAAPLVTVGTAQPASPLAGDLWLDTN